MAVLRRLLTGVLGAAAAVLLCASGAASADPDPTPAPPPPPVYSYKLVTPSDFAVLDGQTYAFLAPGGVTCVISRQSGQYGCAGPFPGAPDGANAVAGNQIGAPTFGVNDAPIIHGVEGELKPLPANSRISFKNITCGTDGTLTTCQNSFDQSGFVISPGGSFVVNQVNPLVDRPKGTSPYAN